LKNFSRREIAMVNIIKKGGMILKGDKLSIFEEWGIFSGGEIGVIPFIRDKTKGFEIALGNRAISTVESIINGDAKEGKLEKIASIQINPKTAIRLYLEGKIIRKNIEEAEFDDQLIKFSGIKFDIEGFQMAFPVIIRANAEYCVATLDKDGDIV
jgi:hypothetical protein